jgi:alkanesulfonate monooxygenase SsuD/methylene tetrahydromethanopterin reductase-like flavin-dependent oxidoreductase (luciferase family)
MTIQAGLFYLFDTLGELSPPECYRQALDEVVYAEQLGFSAVCPAEHHYSENYGIMPRVELFLAMCAARTERIKLWPMLIVAPLADNPVRLAEDIALLDNFSNGRMVASIGTGYRKYEFAPFDLDMADSQARLREIAEVCTKLWGGEPVSHDGEFYKFGEVSLQPRPVQAKMPLYITTTRKEQIQWAAERGFGIVPAAGFNANTLKHDLDMHAAAAKAAGQAPMETRPFFKWIYVHEDHQTGVNEGNQYILRTLMAFAQGGGKLFSLLMGKSLETWGDDQKPPEWLSMRMDELLSAGVTYEQAVESGWTPYVCGSPEHVVEVLKPFVEAGGNLFMGGFKCGPMPEEKVRNSMRLFAEEVLPNL